MRRRAVTRSALSALSTCSTLSTLATMAAPGSARAQAAFPTRTVTLVTPFAAGSAPDALVRALAHEVAQTVATHGGPTVIVDNRPGASSILAAQTVARAAPDGHTLLVSGNVTFTVNPHTFKTLPYDPVRDFEPVAMLARGPMLLYANPRSVPVADPAGLVALASRRAQPLSFGYTSDISRLPAELLQQASGIRLHGVPYKAGYQALPDLLEGRIDLLFTDLAPLAHVRQGRLLALAVADAQRSPLAPAVPTFTEAGIRGVELPYWIAVWAPARTPAPVLQRWQTLLAESLRSAAVRQAAAQGGTLPFTMAAGELVRFQAGEASKWGAIIRAAGMQAQ